MYYGSSNIRKMESFCIIVFMCATVILLWMLMVKIDKKESVKSEYTAKKLSKNIEENVEKDSKNPIENVVKSVVGISKMEKSLSWFIDENIEAVSSGSGVILSENGYILTNEHVAGSKYSNVYVTLENGAKYNANVVWSDESLDLAIVKISANNLDYIMLGDSDNISIGENVYAIGNPIGVEFQRTVTKGIISGKNRTIKIKDETDEMYMEDLIQTDATINEGNSGGALVNEKGELLGINTIKISDAESIGFAVPINIVKPILEKLEKEGTINEAYLGIFAFDKEVVPYLESALEIENGIYVVDVDPLGSITNDFIKRGDVIKKVDDKEVNKMNELRKILFNKKPGETLKMEVLRDNEEFEVEILLKSKM